MYTTYNIYIIYDISPNARQNVKCISVIVYIWSPLGCPKIKKFTKTKYVKLFCFILHVPIMLMLVLVKQSLYLIVDVMMIFKVVVDILSPHVNKS